MDDQISRNTLLRYVADWQYNEAIVGNEAVYDTIEKFYHMVEEMPSEQPESRREWYMHGYRDAHQKWIPIKEALPDDNKDVLVTVHFTRGNIESSYYVDLAYRLNDEWMSYSDDYLMVPKSRLEIIAWMPLPSPFKED